MNLKIYASRTFLFILHLQKINFFVDSKALEIKKNLLKEIAPDKKKLIFSFSKLLSQSNQLIETLDLGKGSTITYVRK